MTLSGEEPLAALSKKVDALETRLDARLGEADAAILGLRGLIMALNSSLCQLKRDLAEDKAR